MKKELKMKTQKKLLTRGQHGLMFFLILYSSYKRIREILKMNLIELDFSALCGEVFPVCIVWMYALAS